MGSCSGAAVMDKMKKTMIGAGLIVIFLSAGAKLQAQTSDEQDAVLSAEEALQKGKEADKNKNYEKAQKWYRIAAEQGNAEAQYKVGDHFLTLAASSGLYDAVAKKDTYESAETVSNVKEGVAWLLKSAEQGHVKAQLALANEYGQEGVAGTALRPSPVLDLAESYKWYRKAAEQGDPRAQYEVGRFFESGRVVGQDKKEAIRWYRKAAAQKGDYAKLAGNALARLSPKTTDDPVEQALQKAKAAEDSKEAEKWFKVAAEKGSAEAQCEMGSRKLAEAGLLSLYGELNDVKVDTRPLCAQGMNWIRKSAGQGYAEAFYQLGLESRNGTCVAEDLEESANWHRKAAEKGHDKAQYQLGVIYEQGLGVEKDIEEAAKWFQKAAEQGNKDAQHALDTRY